MSRLCVEAVHKETIKPFSPTPSNLKTVKLSLIDQHETPHHTPVLLFFSASPVPNLIRVNCLKKSLSETLTLFYPFAGRIIDNQFIHCNDDGINLFETRVNTQMGRVLRHPIPEELVQLTPQYGTAVPRELLSVQINIFNCGGMVLSVGLSHQVGDASSLGFFLSAWAATSRGDPAHKIVHPQFGTSGFFPPIETELPPPIRRLCGTHPELVTKRFIFNASNISTIRDKCFDKLLYRPTRVEAVSAFLWRCAIKVAGWRSSVLLQGINLRTRLDLPLPNSFVGNFARCVAVTSTTESTTPPELESLVGELHRAISEVDGDYVRKLQQNKGILDLFDSFNEPTQVATRVCISSWCRFPFYEADFGWGQPEWVTTILLLCQNLIILLDTKCGTGIEALVTLEKQEMGRFDCDPELIASTSGT